MAIYVLKREKRNSWMVCEDENGTPLFTGDLKHAIRFKSSDEALVYAKRTKKRTVVNMLRGVPLREPNSTQYFRKETYTIDAVLPFIGDHDKYYGEDRISMGSPRYQNFAQHGLTCVCCGVTGSFFAKETTDMRSENPKYHFNLYAIDKDGKEVLMTKDHIIPRSKGGKDSIENYQPMCVRCNQKKGNKLEV